MTPYSNGHLLDRNPLKESGWILATAVSPQSEMVSMSDVGAWLMTTADPTWSWQVMIHVANRGHWMLLHSIEVLGTCKICSQKKQTISGSMDDQWIINGSSMDQWINGSMDDQWMISWSAANLPRRGDEWLISKAATEGIAKGLWANSGAVVLAEQLKSPPFLATKSQRLFSKNMV